MQPDNHVPSTLCAALCCAVQRPALPVPHRSRHSRARGRCLPPGAPPRCVRGSRWRTVGEREARRDKGQRSSSSRRGGGSRGGGLAAPAATAAAAPAAAAVAAPILWKSKYCSSITCTFRSLIMKSGLYHQPAASREAHRRWSGSRAGGQAVVPAPANADPRCCFPCPPPPPLAAAPLQALQAPPLQRRRQLLTSAAGLTLLVGQSLVDVGRQHAVVVEVIVVLGFDFSDGDLLQPLHTGRQQPGTAGTVGTQGVGSSSYSTRGRCSAGQHRTAVHASRRSGAGDAAQPSWLGMACTACTARPLTLIMRPPMKPGMMRLHTGGGLAADVSRCARQGRSGRGCPSAACTSVTTRRTIHACSGSKAARQRQRRRRQQRTQAAQRHPPDGEAMVGGQEAPVLLVRQDDVRGRVHCLRAMQ